MSGLVPLHRSRSVFALFEKICEPVAFAHSRGVLHRDLKPPNVMVGPFGEVLVMDWGVAKIVGGATARHESVSAREHCAAPDRRPIRNLSRCETRRTARFLALRASWRRSRRAVKWRSSIRGADIYSLGAILKFLAAPAAGEKTSRGGSPPSSPRRWREEPQARYTSAQELASDVDGYLDGLPIIAYPEGFFGRAVRVASRAIA